MNDANWGVNKQERQQETHEKARTEGEFTAVGCSVTVMLCFTALPPGCV